MKSLLLVKMLSYIHYTSSKCPAVTEEFSSKMTLTQNSATSQYPKHSSYSTPINVHTNNSPLITRRNVLLLQMNQTHYLKVYVL